MVLKPTTSLMQCPHGVKRTNGFGCFDNSLLSGGCRLSCCGTQRTAGWEHDTILHGDSSAAAAAAAGAASRSVGCRGCAGSCASGVACLKLDSPTPLWPKENKGSRFVCHILQMRWHSHCSATTYNLIQSGEEFLRPVLKVTLYVQAVISLTTLHCPHGTKLCDSGDQAASSAP